MSERAKRVFAFMVLAAVVFLIAASVTLQEVMRYVGAAWSFSFAILAFLGVLFLLQQWQNRNK